MRLILPRNRVSEHAGGIHSVIRLVGGVLAEQTDEWAEGRRYLGLEVLARSRMRVLPDTESEVVADTFIALSA